MAQAVMNSCLICNNLIKSKRRRHNILETCSTETGSQVTIRSRVEFVLDLPLDDCSTTWICDKCFVDLQQIEQYYSLLEQFRQRYRMALQVRHNKGSNSYTEKPKTENMLSQSSEYAANLLLQFDRPGKDRSVGLQTDINDNSDSDVESNSDAGETDALDKSGETVDSSAEEDTQEDSASNSDSDSQSDDQSDAEVEENSTKPEETTTIYDFKDDDDIQDSDSESQSDEETPPSKAITKKKKLRSCKVCGQIYTKHQLKLHMKQTHTEDTEVTANGFSLNGTSGEASNVSGGGGMAGHSCDVCGKRFRTRDKLTRHKVYHDGRKPFVCMLCNKRFVWSWHLQRHVKTHQHALPFMCCDITYHDVSQLTQHMLLHKEGSNMECNLCKELFPNRSLLSEHVRAVHEQSSEPQYTCTICGKMFQRQKKLRKHMSVHNPDTSFKCSLCEKTFKRASSLKAHERQHNGEKPHACPHCSKTYTQPGNLRMHMMTHTWETPFQCTYCGKVFSESTHLKRHMDTHTSNKKHECPDCGKGFVRRDHLTKHMTIHSDLKPHVCSLCDKAFGRLDKMKTHMLTHSRIKASPESKPKRSKKREVTSDSATTSQPPTKKKRTRSSKKQAATATSGIEAEEAEVLSAYASDSAEAQPKQGAARMMASQD